MDRLTRFKTHEQQFGVKGNKRQEIYTQLPVLDKSPQHNDEKNEDSCETQGDDDINNGGRQRS